MALSAANFLTLVGGANALHYYKTTDDTSDVDASGYFNDITHRLKQFDVIIIVGLTGGSTTVDLAVVTSATGAATVTVSTTSDILTET